MPPGKGVVPSRASDENVDVNTGRPRAGPSQPSLGGGPASLVPVVRAELEMLRAEK